MAGHARITTARLIRDYRAAARVGNWDTCSQIVTQLCRHRLDGDLLAELIYADGYTLEHQGDTDNARRCYELAASKGHVKAGRRLETLGGPAAKAPPHRRL